jgi:hypothetical protein
MSIYPPTGTLEIKNATLKIPVVDLQYTSNTAKLEANSNVVTEFSRSKKLIKYPRVALTQNALTNGYAAEASTENNGTSTGQAYRLFDGLANGERGYHSDTTYSSGSTYTGSESITDANGTPHRGEWIKLQMPTTEKMKLSGFSVSPRYVSSAEYQHRAPYKGVFLGSINGTNWYPIHYFDNLAVPELTTVSRTFENTTNDYYNHIALVAYEVGPDATYGNVLNFAEMELYGIPEYDPEAHGTDVTVKSVANVPNTDWLEVYYDAKDLADAALSTESGGITGLGGTTNNGTAYGNPQISDGAFVLDGVDDYITTAQLGFSGDQPYSISIWFRSDKPQIDMTTEHGIYGFGYGNNLYAGLSWWSPVTNGTSSLRHWHSGSGGKNFPYVTFLEDMWNHVVIVYPGGGAFNIRAWLNGVERMGVNNPGNSTNNDFNWSTSDTVVIGDWYSGSSVKGQSPWDGKIANFRLFNRALTSDEIYQLYAYQKEDFGHGDLSMTLKAGRLGIGTSEPRAALDVRGDIYGGCPVFFHATRTSGHLNSATNPVIFNNVVSSKGGGYNASTGKFTCPISGYYKIYCYGVTDSGNHLDLRLQINNSDRTFGKAYVWANVTNHVQAHATSIVYLNQNDVVHYRLEGGSFSGSGTISNQANANGFIMEYFSS